VIDGHLLEDDHRPRRGPAHDGQIRPGRFAVCLRATADPKVCRPALIRSTSA
jgi:hypothetical protein